MDYYDAGEEFDTGSEAIVNIKILHTTHKAVLIQHKNRQAWFPRAVVFHLNDEILEYKWQFKPAWKSILQPRMKSIAGDFI